MMEPNERALNSNGACTGVRRGDVQVAESELKNERVRTKTKMAGPSGARGNETLMNLFW